MINGMPYYLPIGKVTIKGTFAAGDAAKNIPGSWDVTITPEVEVDAKAGVCYAVPHANYMYDDEVQVTVNNKHLLNTGNVTAQDRTVEIIGQVASLATQLRAFTAPPLPNRAPFNFSFHPSDASEYERVKSELKERDIDLDVDPRPSRHERNVAVLPEKDALGESGLLFRPAIAYNIRLRFRSKNGNGEPIPTIDNTQQFILPDPNALYAIGYPRIPFVKRVKQIGFTDGMLTDFHQTTPSPILGFLGIPNAIIKAVLPIPGG